MFRRCHLLDKINLSRIGKNLFPSFLGYSGACCRASLQLMMEKLKENCRALFGSRGCLGCCDKPRLIIEVDQPSKGLKIQGRAVKKPSISEGFWSTSSQEVENNSAIQSQRSVSSMSTSNPPIDLQTGATIGSTSNPTEFVNHGLLLWNETRQQWTAKKSPRNAKQVQEAKLSPSATYESLLGTNKPFPHPIPLSEMVDFLVDVWEQEALYD